MEEVKVKGQYTWLDYSGASRGAHKVTTWSRRLYWVTAIAFGILVISTFQKFANEHIHILMLGYLIAGTFFVISQFNKFIPDKHKQEWHEDKIWNTEFKITFSREKIFSKSEYAFREYLWSHFVRWGEDEERIFFFHSSANYWFLPKRLLTIEELAFIKQLLSENGLKESPGRSLLPQATIWFIGAVLILFLNLFVEYSPVLK